jgi:hypothetical protein
MSNRRVLAAVLLGAALCILLVAAVEFVRHRRVDVLALALALLAAAGAGAVYTRAVG